MDAVPYPVLLPARRPTLTYEEEILYALYRYHYLLLDQIVQLLGNAPSHKGWIQRKKIKPLVRAGYLHEQPLSRKARAGGSPLVYSLATKGKRCLQELDCPVYRTTTPSEQEKGIWYLTHVLELNNVLISAQLLTRYEPDIYLSEFRHDLDMQHTPTQLSDLKGKKRFLVPDGFLDFETSGNYGTRRVSFVVELDRGTMGGADFKERIRNYCDFLIWPYQRDFGSNSCTILWMTTAGTHRVSELRHWTKTELERTQVGGYGVYHRFLAIPALFEAGFSPNWLFLSPVWSKLETDTPIPLLKKRI